MKNKKLISTILTLLITLSLMLPAYANDTLAAYQKVINEINTELKTNITLPTDEEYINKIKTLSPQEFKNIVIKEQEEIKKSINTNDTNINTTVTSENSQTTLNKPTKRDFTYTSEYSYNGIVATTILLAGGRVENIQLPLSVSEYFMVMECNGTRPNYFINYIGPGRVSSNPNYEYYFSVQQRSNITWSYKDGQKSSATIKYNGYITSRIYGVRYGAVTTTIPYYCTR